MWGYENSEGIAKKSVTQGSRAACFIEDMYDCWSGRQRLWTLQFLWGLQGGEVSSKPLTLHWAIGTSFSFCVTSLRIKSSLLVLFMLSKTYISFFFHFYENEK